MNYGPCGDALISWILRGRRILGQWNYLGRKLLIFGRRGPSQISKDRTWKIQWVYFSRLSTYNLLDWWRPTRLTKQPKEIGKENSSWVGGKVQIWSMQDYQKTWWTIHTTMFFAVGRKSSGSVLKISLISFPSALVRLFLPPTPCIFILYG